MKWSEHYRVNSHDCDLRGYVRASLLLRYMQETAYLHFKGAGPSYETLRSRNMRFLLSRINMSFYNPLFAGDEIDVETWACESHGVSFNRCYRIKRGDEVIAEAASVWGLVGIDSHRLIRVGEVELNYGSDEPLELDAPRRVHIPREVGMPLVGERPVVYSDLDSNRHMNNTNYPDMICDFIPDICERRVIAMSISFANEARLGDVLKIYLGRTDDTVYFRSVRPDSLINIEAELILE